MWADATGVKHERIVHLVALGDELLFFRSGVALHESFINGVINHFNAFAGYSEEAGDVVLREVRDGHNSRSVPQYKARGIEVHGTAQAASIGGAIHVVEHVVDRDYIRAGRQVWRQPEQRRHVHQVTALVAENFSQGKVA